VADTNTLCTNTVDSLSVVTGDRVAVLTTTSGPALPAIGAWSLRLS
jgi:hypothetical protein